MYQIKYEDETFAVWLEPEGTRVSLWEEKEPIFVCGRLMDPQFLSSIIGREAAMAPAVALDTSRAWEDYQGKPYTFLKKSKGGFVPGMVLLGLTAQERSKLDRFEEIETVRKMDQLTLKVGNRKIRGISFFKR